MGALVEVKNLINRFGTQTVHEDLCLTLDDKEILGLVGGSGSGKSVLLRSILGLNTPKSGEILIDGVNIQALSVKELLEVQKKWGVVFQNGALFSGLTVLDNVALPMREYTDLSPGMIEELALYKLQMVGLEPSAADKFPSSLSGGMARRVSLARALALDPKILFLDEPTAGLDPIAAAAFDNLILSLREALGLSVLVITHDLDTLVTICDRVAMLVDKHIVMGTIGDMMASEHPWIHEYFNGPRMRAISKNPHKETA
ncbi:MAG: transporter ATP-binding protein [Micavibrio sp.]|nr:transporter ATP-binding protein [Micavibrio sp.]